MFMFLLCQCIVKTLSKNRMTDEMASFADWMSNLNEKLTEIPLSQLAIPGEKCQYVKERSIHFH